MCNLIVFFKQINCVLSCFFIITFIAKFENSANFDSIFKKILCLNRKMEKLFNCIVSRALASLLCVFTNKNEFRDVSEGSQFGFKNSLKIPIYYLLMRYFITLKQHPLFCLLALQFHEKILLSLGYKLSFCFYGLKK